MEMDSRSNFGSSCLSGFFYMLGSKWSLEFDIDVLIIWSGWMEHLDCVSRFLKDSNRVNLRGRNPI